ncbi:MAG: dihydrofolate reductase family protein [Thermoplasmata archaeon]|nr:dihydrofolate reductase family protein [Thermoplasmata archaeon]
MAISLDGFVGGPHGELDWEVRDPEVGRSLIPNLQRTTGTLLFGRTLFEGFRQAWPAMAADPATPKELVEFANWIEETPKVVFSSKLQSTGWRNSSHRRVDSDEKLVAAVEALKRASEKDVTTFGGARFARTLSDQGLVDEYRLKLQPIALGSGLPLFGRPRGPLKLVRTDPFPSGVVSLTYLRS